jgi:hypothetical protein
MFKAVLIILLSFFTFGGVFVAGYLLGHTSVQPSETPIDMPINTSTGGSKFTAFDVGKLYFDDTVVLITETTPRNILVATSVRSEASGSKSQNTRVSFYNGSKWIRQTTTQPISDFGIYGNTILKNWKATVDPTLVLRERIEANINIDKNNISFKSDTLENEMTVRSLPGYTKFISESTAKLTVNGKTYNARIMYTKLYSLNSKSLQFYDTPLGITTDWLIFWDEQGNFYHIDRTDVERPTDVYQLHRIGIYKSYEKSVTKTFNVSVVRDNEVPPKHYTFTLSDPINIDLTLTNVASFEKTKGWFLGLAEGTAAKPDGNILKGFGLIEYIHD